MSCWGRYLSSGGYLECGEFVAAFSFVDSLLLRELFVGFAAHPLRGEGHVEAISWTILRESGDENRRSPHQDSFGVTVMLSR